MSTGVPNTMVVEMKLSTSPLLPQLEGDRDIVGRERRRPRRHRIGLQFLIQLEQFGIGGRLALAVQPLQQMRCSIRRD